VESESMPKGRHTNRSTRSKPLQCPYHKSDLKRTTYLFGDAWECPIHEDNQGQARLIFRIIVYHTKDINTRYAIESPPQPD